MAIELILRLICEVDDNIAAEDQVKARLELIPQEIVTLELDHTLDFLLHGKTVTIRVEIFAAALRRHTLDLIRRIDTTLRLRENLDIEIRGENAVSRPRCHLFHDDRERIRFCSDGAACAPNIELRGAFQEIRNDIRLKLAELLRRAEEL